VLAALQGDAALDVAALVWQGLKSCVLSAEEEGGDGGEGNPPARTSDQHEKVNSVRARWSLARPSTATAHR